MFVLSYKNVKCIFKYECKNVSLYALLVVNPLSRYLVIQLSRALTILVDKPGWWSANCNPLMLLYYSHPSWGNIAFSYADEKGTE